MIAYVLPTRNRPGVLARTLEALGRLPEHPAEVIVVDNASASPVSAPARLANGLTVRVLRRAVNRATGARNDGVRVSDPASRWIVMLDDDSSPLDLGHVQAIREAEGDPAIVAVQAEITLPGGTREAGGLPEVFVGCGVAIRRDAFNHVHGYDEAFDYYAEEYDLSARLLLEGGRVVFDDRFRVRHEKHQGGRSFGRILRRLVRHNCWVIARYAPGGVRGDELTRTLTRYAQIGAKERARVGWAMGAVDAAMTTWRQPRSAMPIDLWDRFTGLAAARAGLSAAMEQRAFGSAVVVRPGKNAHLIERALGELGVRVVDPGEPSEADAAEAVVVGTLSPGPTLDALEGLRADPRMSGRRIVAAWNPRGDRVMDAGSAGDRGRAGARAAMGVGTEAVAGVAIAAA